MKRIFLGFLCIFCVSFLVVSCEEESPSIDFAVSTQTQDDLNRETLEALLKRIQELSDSLSTMDSTIIKLQAALDALTKDNGVFRIEGDRSAIYMNPLVWNAIKDDELLQEAIAEDLVDCSIPFSLQNERWRWMFNYYAIESPTPSWIAARLYPLGWDNTSIVINGQALELIKVTGLYSKKIFTFKRLNDGSGNPSPDLESVEVRSSAHDALTIYPSVLVPSGNDYTLTIDLYDYVEASKPGKNMYLFFDEQLVSE